MSRVEIILITAIIVLPILLFFAFTRNDDDWKRLNCKEYSTMDDRTLLKHIMKIDSNTRKEVDAVGGAEAMLATAGGMLGEKERKRFANLVFLNDAFVGMGAPHAVVTAVLDREKDSDCLKMEIIVDDIAETLPVIAELYEILHEIDTSPIDVAEWLVDDYIANKSEEKRAKTVKRIRKYTEVGNSVMRLWALSNLNSRK